jgi:hypothetical protein
MSGISGFVDYDDQGRPFMGLIIEDQVTRTQIYLSHRANATECARELASQIQKMANELKSMADKPKLIEANGVIPDAFGKRKG